MPDVDWGNAPAGPAELYAQFPSEVAASTVIRLEEVRSIEADATSAIRAAMAAAGARPHGLAFRMKSPASTARKIQSKLLRSNNVAALAVADRLTDLLRYTALTKTSTEVVPAARATVGKLVDQGWQVVEAEHSFIAGNPYKGLHVLLRHPASNLVIELQFHTDRAQHLKDISHLDYERERDDAEPVEVRAAAHARMVKLWSGVRLPSGIDGLVVDGVRVNAKVYPNPYKTTEQKGRTS